MLQVYEGTSAVGMPLATLSGSLLPAALQVASGRFHVVFSSDSTVQGSGFVATYSTVQPAASAVTDTGINEVSVPRVAGQFRDSSLHTQWVLALEQMCR